MTFVRPIALPVAVGAFTAIALIVTAPASAARLVLDAPGDACFSAQVPPGWLVAAAFEPGPEDDPELPRVVSLFPDPEDQVWLGLWHARLVGSLDEAKARFDDLDGALFDDPVVETATDRTLAGFPAFQLRGTATSDGEPVTFGVVGFAYAPGAIGVAVFVGEDGAWTAHAETVAATLDSIRTEQAACP